MQTFSQKLNPFFETLTYGDLQLAYRAVSYLVLLDNVKLYDEMMYLLSSKLKSKELLKPLKAAITDSYLTRAIWRSCIRIYRDGISIEDSAKKENISPSDVYFCLDGLPNRDLSTFIKFSTTEDVLLKPLSDKDLAVVLKGVTKFCKLLAYKKLAFISTADHAILPEDLCSELQTKALKLIRYYEHLHKNGIHDLLKIENYVKQGIKNYLTNFIHFYTTKKRARIFSVQKDCGACKLCREQTGFCANQVEDYQISTYRLDYDTTDSMLKDASTLQCSPEQQFSSAEFYNAIKSSLDSKMAKFVDILYDKNLEDFESWLLNTKNVKLNDITDNRKLTNYALNYLNLSRSKVQRVLQYKYKSITPP
jgi:hypothetical protein